MMLLKCTLFAALPTAAWCFSLTQPSSLVSSGQYSHANRKPTSVHNEAIRGSPLWVAKGFGEKKASKSTKSAEKNMKKIYSVPALYDLAMGYRNYEAEVEFLLDAHKKFSGQKSRPKSVIEVASGPGRHCIQALKSDMAQRSIALDLSEEMVEYGREVAKEELGDNKVSNFDFLCGDMRSFALEDRETCDSAWILAGSLQHLTTNTDVIACMNSINKALSPQGTLILELPHPNEVFQMVDSTTNSWEVPLEDDEGHEYGQLLVVWGDEDDEIDPIQQVRQNTVVLKLKGVEDPKKQSVNGVVPLRLFTAQEISLFAQLSGFEVAAMYGALSDEFDINNEDVAYRLVCILRKE